jgi:hypothetical protein
VAPSGRLGAAIDPWKLMLPALAVADANPIAAKGIKNVFSFIDGTPSVETAMPI